MPSADTLVWILGEVIFVLLILCIFLLLITLKFKKSLHLLQEEYRELRKRTRHIISELDYSEANPLPEKLHGDPIGIFLHSGVQYSLERFHKFFPGGIPRLIADAPLGAKAAALRYIYMMAETENRTKQNNPENWLLLEKNLMDVTNWVKNQPKQPGSSSRAKQDNADALKKQEAESVRLKRQLAYAREKNQKIEEQNKENKNHIRKMQAVINALQQVMPSETVATQVTPAESSASRAASNQRQEKAHNAYQSQVSSITTLTDKKHELLNQIQDVSASFKHLSKDEKNKFELQIKNLETNILKSDFHITSLQKELKSARMSPPLSDDIDNILAVNLVDGIELPLPATNQQMPIDPSWSANGGHERTIEEIENLRNNNQNQRKTIIELNTEIELLRNSMETTLDETLKEEKNIEILKLERLVKECEFCIETLESEVELLREQMEDERESDQQHPDIEKLNREITQMTEQLNQTVAQYSHANAINNFSIKLLECMNVESIAKLISDTLKKMNVSFGFYLVSDIDQIEYHSEGKHSPEEQRVIKAPDSATHIGYINEGILFFRHHVRLILKNPPEEDEANALLETTLNSLVQMVNSKINHIQSLGKISTRDSELGKSLEQVKSNILRIKTKQNDQSQEFEKIINDLTKEIEVSVKLMKPSPAIKSVFDNSISECYQRIDRLQNESKNIENYADEIISALQNL